MGIHWLNNITELLGKPYALNSNPPHTFNCWTLINYIYPNTPSFTPTDLKEYVEMFNKNMHVINWVEVDTPMQGDILLFAKANYFSHAGIYLDNDRVLHAKDKVGVVNERLNMLKLSYKNIKAYRWQK